MSCTDIIPRDELNSECMNTGRTIIDFTNKNCGNVTADQYKTYMILIIIFY